MFRILEDEANCDFCAAFADMALSCAVDGYVNSGPRPIIYHEAHQRTYGSYCPHHIEMDEHICNIHSALVGYIQVLQAAKVEGFIAAPWTKLHITEGTSTEMRSKTN